MEDVQELIKRIRELPEPQQDMGENYSIYEVRRDEFNITIDDVIAIIERYFKSG